MRLLLVADKGMARAGADIDSLVCRIIDKLSGKYPYIILKT